MKSISKNIFIAFFALLFASNIGYAQDSKVYINGTDISYPPFAYINERGQADGFEVKALEWIAKEMGFTIKHQPMEWDRIITSLIEGKIDMICSGISITPEREQRVRFTEPYLSYPRVIVTSTTSDLVIDDIYTKSIKLGVQRSTSEHAYLEKAKLGENYEYIIFPYISGPRAIRELNYDRIDAVALDYFVAKDAMSKGSPIKIIGDFYEPAQFAIATRKNSADDNLHKLLNEGYRRLKADPYWEELKKTYLIGVDL